MANSRFGKETSVISTDGAVNLGMGVLVDGWRRLHFALLPPHCLLCGAPGDGERDLCRGCAGDLPLNRIACVRCALPLTTAAALCGECLRSEPAFASAFVPLVYAHPTDLLLTRLKFSRNLAAGRVLTQLWLDAYVTTAHTLPQALIPVPLHVTRLRERGFNQAREIAKPIADALQVPLFDAALVRVRATSPQSDLDAAARRRNLRGAFEAADGVSALRHVALVDDVMTTGTTVRECARVLTRAGVARVDIWAVARAPK
jgi:ComF family protein